MQGARGFPGLPGLSGLKGHKVIHTNNITLFIIFPHEKLQEVSEFESVQQGHAGLVGSRGEPGAVGAKV